MTLVAPTSALVPYLAVEAIGVVVPAHDEEERIDACLDSLERAAGHPAVAGIPVEVVVVLDSCTDGTADRVAVPRLLRVSALPVRVRNVGQARHLGLADLLSRREAEGSGLWLACTDADSTVPTNWFARQLAWRRAGAEAVAGTIAVQDWSGHPVVARHRFERHQARLGLGHGHRHVHGANLAFSADAYRAVGGMPRVSDAEDHALWTALRSGGHRTVAAGDLTVTTSARTEGRARYGFSAFVGSLGREHAAIQT